MTRYKAHGASVYYYLKKRAFSYIFYSLLTALFAGTLYALFLLAVLFIYLLALKRAETIIISSSAVIICKGVLIKRKVFVNKQKVGSIKAKKGILGRIFRFRRIRLFYADNLLPLGKIVIKEKQYKQFVAEIL